MPSQPSYDSKTRKAIVYCRVSTKGQEDGTSLESQADACVRHAESLGYVVDHVTRETYSGAELWDRPKLAQDRADIKASKVQALVVYATDRLSRDPIHLAIIAEECQKAGVELIFVTEPIDNSREGQLIQYVKGYAASIEREKIRERQLRGKQTRLRNGKLHNHGHELYGYIRDKDHGVRLIKEAKDGIADEADTVRRIYQWVADGKSLRWIARTLNAEGVPSPSFDKIRLRGEKQARWGSGQLHRILRNPAYAGRTVTWRYQGHGAKKNSTIRDESEWITLPDGTTPAIVSEALWNTAQQKLDTNKGLVTRNEKTPYLLRGLVLCAVCGLRMHPDKEKGQFRVYRCHSRQTPDGACGAKRVPAEAVEQDVWSKIAHALSHPYILTRQIEQRRESGEASRLENDLASARQSLTQRDREFKALEGRVRQAASDDFMFATLRNAMEKVEKERQAIRSCIADLEHRIADEQRSLKQLTDLEAYCQAVSGDLDTFSFEQKRRALEAWNIQVLANGRTWNLKGIITTSEGEDLRSHVTTLVGMAEGFGAKRLQLTNNGEVVSEWDISTRPWKELPKVGVPYQSW